MGSELDWEPKKLGPARQGPPPRRRGGRHPTYLYLHVPAGAPCSASTSCTAYFSYPAGASLPRRSGGRYEHSTKTEAAPQWPAHADPDSIQLEYLSKRPQPPTEGPSSGPLAVYKLVPAGRDRCTCAWRAATKRRVWRCSAPCATAACCAEHSSASSTGTG